MPPKKSAEGGRASHHSMKRTSILPTILLPEKLLPSRPIGTMVFDGEGNLYGTTIRGGNVSNGQGQGVFFELSPPAISGGAWISVRITHAPI
jgi:hypothetical protein